MRRDSRDPVGFGRDASRGSAHDEARREPFHRQSFDQSSANWPPPDGGFGRGGGGGGERRDSYASGGGDRRESYGSERDDRGGDRGGYRGDRQGKIVKHNDVYQFSSHFR